MDAGMGNERGTHMTVVTATEAASAMSGATEFLEFGFAQRWARQLAKAEREGGWWALDALSHNGKTTGNKRFAAQRLSHKLASGETVVPVALCCAHDAEHILLASLAESIGGTRLLRQPQRLVAIGRAIGRVRVRVVIVNNAHNLSWRGYNALLTLEEHCKATGSDPAIVLSSIKRNIALASAPSGDGTLDQLRRRVSYVHVKGNSRDEVADGLNLRLQKDRPELLRRGFVERHSSLVFELLTQGIFSNPDEAVVTSDLIETMRRMVAIHRQDPKLDGEEVVRRAVTHLIASRTPQA